VLYKKIVVSPFYYIIYWNESGLRLYNDRAKESVLYWDATGGMIRKTANNKRFLYNELAIANPVKGRMGIAITSMVSGRQSLPVVLDWLREFIYAEKSLFGYFRIIIQTNAKQTVLDVLLNRTRPGHCIFQHFAF